MCFETFSGIPKQQPWEWHEENCWKRILFYILCSEPSGTSAYMIFFNWSYWRRTYGSNRFSCASGNLIRDERDSSRDCWKLSDGNNLEFAARIFVMINQMLITLCLVTLCTAPVLFSAVSLCYRYDCSNYMSTSFAIYM